MPYRCSQQNSVYETTWLLQQRNCKGGGKREVEGNLYIKTDLRDNQPVAINRPYLDPGSNKLFKNVWGTLMSDNIKLLLTFLGINVILQLEYQKVLIF